MCSADEAVLLLRGGGFTLLDVRTADEASYALSSATPCLRTPLIHATWRFDAAAKKRLPQQRANASFVAEVKSSLGGELDRPVLVVCSDGRTRTRAALMALDAAGFTCLVGLQGGYNAFTLAYDAKLAPRVTDSTGAGRKSPWKEVNGAEALSSTQTTMGLNHAGGAGFEQMDAPDNQFPLRDPVQWIAFEADGPSEDAAEPQAQAAAVQQASVPAGRGQPLRDGSVLFSF